MQIVFRGLEFSSIAKSRTNSVSVFFFDKFSLVCCLVIPGATGGFHLLKYFGGVV